MWNRLTFDRYYESSVEWWGHPSSRPEIRLHYHYCWVGTAQRNRIPLHMVQALGPIENVGIVLVGAGFGWTAEGLEKFGANVIATDISDYILSTQQTTEEAEIRIAIEKVGLDPDRDKIIGPNRKQDLDPIEFLVRGGRNAIPRSAKIIIGEDLSTNASRHSVVKRFNNPIKWIITEQIVNSISDDDVLELCVSMDTLSKYTGATVVHLLSPKQPHNFQDPNLNWKLYTEWRTFFNQYGFNSHKIMGSTPIYKKSIAYGVLL